MIWKIAIIILCLLWVLPLVYVKQLKKIVKKYEDEIDDCESMERIYCRTTEDVQKEFARLKDLIDNQRKITNGWEHKIRILDEEIRKLKKE